MMREALIKINSERLKRFIKAATDNKLKALITGIIASTVIQSSSGVTAIVIALISSNLMTLTQGILIMIGANVGTTTTAFIFTLNIERYSLFIIFLGSIFYYFKNRRLHIIGSAIIGFGILFLGIFLMNQGFDYISDSRDFYNFTMYMSNNNLSSLLGGTFLSAAIQSSSATISITQSLYNMNAISLKSAICIMLGANVGTTVASLIPAIGSTKTAKQSVYINIIFNIAGALLFIIFLTPFANLLLYINYIFPNKKLTIAYAHLIFNIISTVIIIFFIDRIIIFTSGKNDLTTKYKYDKLTT